MANKLNTFISENNVEILKYNFSAETATDYAKVLVFYKEIEKGEQSENN